MRSFQSTFITISSFLFVNYPLSGLFLKTTSTIVSFNFLVSVGNPGEECFENQRYFQPSGPLVNSEFYPGWINNWGIPFQHRDADTVAKNLDSLLSANVSVNVYMFHGGTNFGFMNGIIFSGFFNFCK